MLGKSVRIVVLFGLFSGPSIAQERVRVEIDAAERFQTFDGFGGSLTTFETDGIFHAHDPTQPRRVTATVEQRRMIAEALYARLGLTRTRVVLSGFEPHNDNADPQVLNPDAFDWTAVDPAVAWLKIGKPLGLSTPFASFSLDGSERDAWRRRHGSACALDPAKLDEEVEWLYAAALRFRELGFELPYLAVNNEPDLCGAEAKIEIGDMVAIVKRLGARLQAAGIGTRIVVSDGWVPANALKYMKAVLSDPEARPFVGALAFHSYDFYDDPTAILETSGQGQPPHLPYQVREEIRNLGTAYGLPIWMTEVCYCTPRHLDDFDLIRARLNHLHDELTITGASAFDVMNLYFLERPGVDDELVHVFFAPDGALSRFEVSAYGTLLGHYSRVLPPGSVRVAARSSTSTVRVTAFLLPGGAISIVALNNGAAEVQMEIALTGLMAFPPAVYAVTSTRSALWSGRPDVAIRDGRGSVPLPARSVTTLSSRSACFGRPPCRVAPSPGIPIQPRR